MKTLFIRRHFRFVCGITAFLGLVAISTASASTLLWSDEFNQAENSAPDPAKWVFDLGNDGWGNRELEKYTDSRENSFIAADSAATDGKALVIRALHSHGIYTSARLKTQGKFACRYGRIEARLKCPSGQGLWPAFWMLGENIATVGWPTSGEIDIMEMVGEHPSKNLGTIHGPGYSGSHGISGSYLLPPGETFDGAYHVFAVDWSPDKIVWSVDNHIYHSLTPVSLSAPSRWVFNQPFHLLLNLAVGGNLPGPPDSRTHLPQDLTIDYVRVYAAPTAAGNTPLQSERSSTRNLK